MKVLFLPNFPVIRLCQDDPTVRSANKVVSGAEYWFFSGRTDIVVHVIDNWSPRPLSVIERYSHVEFTQAFRALKIQRQYDIILSHSYNSGFIFSLIRSLRRKSMPPHVVIDIGCLNGNRSNPIQIALIREGLKSVKGLIYHSRVNEEFYSSHFPDLRRKFVPFGVDTGFFKPMMVEPTGEYAISIGKRFRDYETLVEAWKNVDYPLRIVGPGGLDTKGNRKIEVIPETSIDNLHRLIHHARFVILPIEARRYSMGQMTMLQCMSMRKPIIVTDVPGISDYIRSGRNCMTVHNGSAEDIETAAHVLLSDKTFAERIAAEARLDAVEKYDEKIMASRIFSFLDELYQDSE